MKVAAGVVGLAWALGCSEPPPPVVAPRPEPKEAPDVPTYCASKAKPCVPPPDFVELLCKDRYVSVAPYLFQKQTPFVRLHAKSRTIELKNGFKGPTGDQPHRVRRGSALVARHESGTGKTKASTRRGVRCAKVGWNLRDRIQE